MANLLMETLTLGEESLIDTSDCILAKKVHEVISMLNDAFV